MRLKDIKCGFFATSRPACRLFTDFGQVATRARTDPTRQDRPLSRPSFAIPVRRRLRNNEQVLVGCNEELGGHVNGKELTRTFLR